MAVSRVSASEIQLFRENNFVVNNYAAAKPSKQIKPIAYYVDDITDKKIMSFFTPYGYIDHERSDNGTILVHCNDCQIIFDDFTVLAAPVENEYLPEDLRFYSKFAELCEQANITPSQAIADRLESEVFNKMPYYVERKKTFNQNNLNNIARHQIFGSLLQASVDKQKHRENLASLNKTYGSSDPEQIADTLARLNPNK